MMLKKLAPIELYKVAQETELKQPCKRKDFTNSLALHKIEKNKDRCSMGVESV